MLRRSVVGLLGFLLLPLPLLCMRAFDGYGGMEEIKKGRNSGEEEEEEEKEATGKTMEDGAGFATKQNSIFEMDRRIHTEVRHFRCDLFRYIGEFLLPPPPPHYSLPAQTLSLFLPLPLPPKPEDLANRKCGEGGRRGRRNENSSHSPPLFLAARNGTDERTGQTFFLVFPFFCKC